MDPIAYASSIVGNYKARLFPPYTKQELYAKVKYLEEEYKSIDGWFDKWLRESNLPAAGLNIKELNEQKQKIIEGNGIIARAIKEFNIFVEPFQEERNMDWLRNTETEPALRRIKGHIDMGAAFIFISYNHFQGKEIIYSKKYIEDILSEATEQRRIKTTPDEYKAMDGKALFNIIQWGRGLKPRITRIINSSKANKDAYESDPDKNNAVENLEIFWNSPTDIDGFVNFYNEKCPTITLAEMLKDKETCKRIINDPNFLDGNTDPIIDKLNDYVMAYDTIAKRLRLFYYV